MQAFNEREMDGLLRPMLLPGEELLCAVYCAFRQKTFFGSNVIPGYAACTSGQRLLFIQFPLYGGHLEGACALPTAKKVKVKKALFGQSAAEAVFPGNEKEIRLRIQAAPSIGKKFPDQRRNLEAMLDILKKYEN